MATTKTQVPSIPAVPKNEREAIAFNNSIKEALEVRLGRRGDPKDRAVTLRELIDSGMAKELLDNPFDPNAGAGVTDFASSSTYVDGKLDDTNDLTAPSTPTGLAASAGRTKLILNWNKSQVSNLAHTEVWRSSDSSLGNAVRHDTTEATVWVDSVDPGDQFYYWIRHVTTAGIFSPFAGSVNATASTLTAAHLTADTITTASGIIAEIDASQIDVTNITANNISTGTLNGSNVTVTNLSATNITGGSLNVDRIAAGSLNLAGKAVTGSVGTVVASNSITDSAIPDDTNVHNYLTTYWASSPFHASGSTYVHIPTDSGGNKSVLEWTTPNWTAASSSSTTKEYVITASLNATGQLVGDGRAENLTALSVRQRTDNSITLTNGFQSSSSSDFILSKSIVRAAGDHVLGTVVISHKLDLLPNTTYYAWLFHGISDYGPSGSTDGGVSDAIITVQGLGV